MTEQSISSKNVLINGNSKLNYNNETLDASTKPINEMTSKDYYFDSYAHFGIHEVFYFYLK